MYCSEVHVQSAGAPYGLSRYVYSETGYLGTVPCFQRSGSGGDESAITVNRPWNLVRLPSWTLGPCR